MFLFLFFPLPFLTMRLVVCCVFRLEVSSLISSHCASGCRPHERSRLGAAVASEVGLENRLTCERSGVENAAGRSGLANNAGVALARVLLLLLSAELKKEKKETREEGKKER